MSGLLTSPNVMQGHQQVLQQKQEPIEQQSQKPLDHSLWYDCAGLTVMIAIWFCCKEHICVIKDVRDFILPRVAHGIINIYHQGRLKYPNRMPNKSDNTRCKESRHHIWHGMNSHHHDRSSYNGVNRLLIDGQGLGNRDGLYWRGTGR